MGNEKKGIALYKMLWILIGFEDLMFLFSLAMGYKTAVKVAGLDDPSAYLRAYNFFCLGFVIFVGIVITVLCRLILSRLRRGAGELSVATKSLTKGDLDIKFTYNYDDEFGKLIDDFALLVEETREQSSIAEAVSKGDFTVDLNVRSDKDLLGSALHNMVKGNNSSMTSIRDAANQVATSASEVASASEALAQGSTEQASAIEEITASIVDITDKTKTNAKEAGNASSLVEKAISNVNKGNDQMNEMMLAMNQINESSERIYKIIKVIDDIAFQTNILALNAAVEAARAGEAGKGFAVVAEEVRNLAAKSAQAAAETAELIEDSITKVEAGSDIAKHTAKALEEITKAVSESESIIAGIAESSNYQATAIAQVDQAIEQVSQVVQTNSATSQQCAAASMELSSQAGKMKELLSIYKLTDTNNKSDFLSFSPTSSKMTTQIENDVLSNEDLTKKNNDVKIELDDDFSTNKDLYVASAPEPKAENESIISLDGGFGKY